MENMLVVFIGMGCIRLQGQISVRFAPLVGCLFSVRGGFPFHFRFTFISCRLGLDTSPAPAFHVLTCLLLHSPSPSIPIRGIRPPGKDSNGQEVRGRCFFGFEEFETG